MKKISLSTLLLALALGLLAFAGAFAGGLHCSGVFQMRRAAAGPAHAAAAIPTEKGLSRLAKELDGWSKELAQKKQRLVEMDQSLLQRDNLLKAEREALDRERQKLLDLQKRMESHLITIEKDKTANLERLADLYNTLKPEESSRLMRQFPDDQATRLLVLMKTNRSARLIEFWSSQFPEDRERIAKVMDQIRIVTRNLEPLADDKTETASSKSNPP